VAPPGIRLVINSLPSQLKGDHALNLMSGKCRTVGWEGHGVVLANRHLQGCSPFLSRLRTDGLATARIKRTDRMLVIWAQ
jgi:hypothetical protein